MESDETVSLRVATPADADALATLAGELGYPATGSVIGRRLDDVLNSGKDVVLMATRAGLVVAGFMCQRWHRWRASCSRKFGASLSRTPSAGEGLAVSLWAPLRPGHAGIRVHGFAYAVTSFARKRGDSMRSAAS